MKTLKFDVIVKDEDGTKIASRPVTLSYTKELEEDLATMHGKDLKQQVAEMILESVKISFIGK